jgi:hypothetical protein
MGIANIFKTKPVNVEESLVGSIKTKLLELETEIAERNEYMNERDNILYDEDYLVGTLDIKAGFDITNYNFLPRAIEIHKSQVMGRGFNIVSRYDNEDIPLDTPIEAKDMVEKEVAIINKKRAVAASNSKRGVEGVIEDNGGFSIFTDMAGVASTYGHGIIKRYWDDNEKRERVVSIESPQLFRAGWRSNDFRERDFDAVVYDVSLDYANKTWGSKLKDGDKFITQSSAFKDTLKDQTSRPMVTVIDFAGVVPGVNDDKPFHCLIVGDKKVGYETNPDNLPTYYLFPNKVRYRRPWGGSDVSDISISIQQSYMQRMSDYTTLIDKILFPKIKGKGFEAINMPKAEAREVQVFPMGLDQDLEIMQFNPMTYPYDRILNEIKESLFRSLALGRVLIDDPTVSFESNQALMTGMKSTIDVAEDKQNRWKPILTQLLSDIHQDLIKHNKTYKDSIADETIIFDIEWPSVLRKEDASYRTMLFNDVTRGLSSFETYLNKIGCPDASEEMDRVRSEMKDPVLGAILSANLRMINQVEIQEDQQEEMELKAAQMGIQLGPDGQPIQPQGPGQTGAPLSTDQNQPGQQPSSGPGTGAPAVSPEGMAATMSQNNGV